MQELIEERQTALSKGFVDHDVEASSEDEVAYVPPDNPAPGKDDAQIAFVLHRDMKSSATISGLPSQSHPKVAIHNEAEEIVASIHLQSAGLPV